MRHPDHATITDELAVVTIHDPEGHYRLVAMPHVVLLEPVREQARKPGKR